MLISGCGKDSCVLNARVNVPESPSGKLATMVSVFSDLVTSINMVYVLSITHWTDVHWASVSQWLAGHSLLHSSSHRSIFLTWQFSLPWPDNFLFSDPTIFSSLTRQFSLLWPGTNNLILMICISVSVFSDLVTSINVVYVLSITHWIGVHWASVSQWLVGHSLLHSSSHRNISVGENDRVHSQSQSLPGDKLCCFDPAFLVICTCAHTPM